MKPKFRKVSDILRADTDDLRELMKIAGGNPRTFFIGADFSSIDIEPEDLKGLVLHGATFRPAVTPEVSRKNKEKSTLMADLRQAVDQQKFELHFQPQYFIKEQRLMGFEALLRWQHDTRGHISPHVFIELLEEGGLIGELGEWVLNNACSQHRVWLEKGLIEPTTTMSINVSESQLAMPNFAERVENILEKQSMRTENLILEITETTLMAANYEAEMIHQLSQLGVKISLDDFGTGYSSLAYLTKIPLDQLKIDRAFITNIMHDKNSKAIVKSIISLADTIGIRVMAEGVEDNNTFSYLLAEGCEGCQGYYICKPLPAGEMASRLESLVSRVITSEKK